MVLPNAEADGGVSLPETTGRYLVLLDERAIETGVQSLTNATGLRIQSVGGSTSDMDVGTLETSEALVFNELSVAIVHGDPEQSQVLSSIPRGENAILAVEPERIVRAYPHDDALLEYLRGYRDGVNQLVDHVLSTRDMRQLEEGIPGETEEREFTWGLQATRVPVSKYTGQGIRIAVLDTGMDLEHPDFLGRTIAAQSFVSGEDAQDSHGHGTHCIGIACGPEKPDQLPRYGIAYNADIYAGKVLSDQGRGTDGSILAGINWAITNQCTVISLSLGAAVLAGQTFSQVYETVARRTLAKGALIIAAAGNESQRPTTISPVGHPANCPSIMAVAAVDRELNLAFFSNGGLMAQGGQVDIAGPGVNVRSSWPDPTLYHTISGTSMATPHVAGIAALLAEANPDVRGGPLGWLLLQSARRLMLPSRDVGAGLVQAP